MNKIRLVMKRLHTVQAGDIMVGRSQWQLAHPIRLVTGVTPSHRKPGKLRLFYRLEGMGQRDGWVDRWPDYYVICLHENGGN